MPSELPIRRSALHYITPIYTMKSWQLLPPELRLMVLDLLADDPAPKKKTKFSKYPLTQYSLVCRDWQIFFERLLYRRLCVDRASLYNFKHFVHRQRCFVKHIRLNVDVKAFEHLARKKFDMGFLSYESSNLSETLKYLFRILSCWQPEFICSKDLTFEITGCPRTRITETASRLTCSAHCSGPLKIPRYSLPKRRPGPSVRY
ncbi:F-box domain-containing protein [Fusarium sp. LHS14.1]|nr:F-box domain-containing protein [Fusarium sp. LHS14.1]